MTLFVDGGQSLSTTSSAIKSAIKHCITVIISTLEYNVINVTTSSVAPPF